MAKQPQQRIPVRVTGKYLVRFVTSKQRDDRGRTRTRRTRERCDTGAEIEVGVDLLWTARDRLTPLEPLDAKTIENLRAVAKHRGAPDTAVKAQLATWQSRMGQPEPVDEADAGEGEADIDELRALAEALGVTVDQRWREKRLRAEIDQAGDDLRRRAHAVGLEIDASKMGPAEAREAVEKAEREAGANGNAGGGDDGKGTGGE